MKPITRKEKIIAGEQLTPITREEMFLKKYGGGGGSTVQSDLAQNDPTQPDYVKNRTHYVEFAPIIEQQTIEGFAVMQDSIYTVQNPFVFTPTVGQKYIVHWDGDEYSVDAKELDGIFYIGNENYVNMISGGDIPFAIIFAGSDVFVSTESTAASHTISIGVGEVHKLDKKFLPESLQFGESDPVTLFTLELDPDTDVNSQWDSVTAQGFSHTQANMATYDLKKNIGAVDLNSLIGAKAVYTSFYSETTEEIIVSVDNISSDVLTVSNNDVSLSLSADGSLVIGLSVNPSNWKPNGTFTSLLYYEVKTIDPKYLPDVSDLDATWLAELKTALGI